MSAKTGISWTNSTWNPVRGCAAVSSGCKNCFATAQAARIVRMAKGLKATKYDGLVKMVGGSPRWTGRVTFFPEDLAAPLAWTKPRKIFVCSMSDLFHELVSDAHIAAVFGIMAAAPRHTFQLLTKRPERMLNWFRAFKFRGAGMVGYASRFLRDAGEDVWADRTDNAGRVPGPWPLPNVWVGTSVEDQDAAEERIPLLLQVPAAVRFLSVEPLLGPVDLRPWRLIGAPPGLHWIIAGCESGPGARPAQVDWFRTLRDQCAAEGVAYFMKQAVGTYETDEMVRVACHADSGDEPVRTRGVDHGPGSRRKAGGLIELPYLDGTQHASWPEVP